LAGTLVLAGLLSGGATAGAAGPGRSGSFRALTYNVAGLPEPLSGSEPVINTPQISPKLNAYDVVLVQEDWIDPVPPVGSFDFHHDDLISQVTHPYLSTPAAPPVGRDPRRPEALIGDGLNFLSRLPFGEVYRQMWPGCFGGIDTSDGGAADCLSQKGFAVTRLQIADGLTIDLYDLHAEAGSTPEDVRWSAADFEVLAQFINTYSVNQTVLIGGDFNLHTGEEPDSTVFDNFLSATGATDVCGVLDCGTDADEIDKFVFRNGPIVTLTPTTHRFERDVFVRAGDNAPLSDHDALRVDWSWSAPAPEDTPVVTTVPFPATYQIPGTEVPTTPADPTAPPAPAPVVAPVPVAATEPRFTG
jgi:hypothetical protein